MDLEKVIKYLDKNFRLPDPRIWKKANISRIYYNHPKYRNSFTYIEFGDKLHVSNYDNYWMDIFGMKPEGLRKYIMHIDKNIDILISNYFIITREPPVLYAYRALYSPHVDNIAEELTRLTNANWIYANYRLLCDRKVNQIKLDKIVEQLSDKYNELTKLVKLNNYPPNPIDVAKWFATFINNRIDGSRLCNYMLIDNKPVLEFNSISKLDTIKDMMHTKVGDITSKLRGYISHQSGIMKDERKRLLSLTSREKMQQIIINAKDEERVFAVKVGNKIYDYPESALYIVNREIEEYHDLSEKFDFIRRMSSSTHPKLFIKSEMLDISNEFKIHYFIKIVDNKAELYKNTNFVVKKDLMSIITLIKKHEAVIFTIGYSELRNNLIKKNKNLGLIEIYHEGALNRNNMPAKRGDIMKISRNEYLIMLDKTVKIKYFNISGNDAVKSVLKQY